jgi:glycosyltransferase involved in cell wall biosynthesis
MAEGFAGQGHQVTVLCRQSTQGKVNPEELTDIYGLVEPLHWVHLPQKIWRYPIDQHWLFTLIGLPVLLRIKPDLVFARNYIFPYVSCKIGFQTVAETHAHAYVEKHDPRFLTMIKGTANKRFRLLVTISKKLSAYYKGLGVPEEKLLVLPDAVDLNLFRRPHEIPPSPFPGGKPVVVYAGHLYDYKGIPNIIEAAALLPHIDFHLVGGLSEDISRQALRVKQRGLQNVIIHGMKKHREIPLYLWHAAALLLPPSVHHPSAEWTSPIKLGEYLASGSPIVATDIPALRDWLNDDEVHFVQPDNPEALAQGILHVINDTGYAHQLAKKGIKKAENLSYKNRAQSIMDRI